VVDSYRQAVADEEGRAHREEKEERERAPETSAAEPAAASDVLRWGSGAAEIAALRLLDERGEERYHFRAGESVVFEISARANRAQEDFVFGVALTTPRGVEVWGTNTDLGGLRPEQFEGEARVRLVCPSLRLGPGEYLVDVAVHARDGAPYDYRRRLASFSVTANERGIGVYFPEHRWEFAGGVRIRERNPT
jgi:hypothetical protein